MREILECFFDGHEIRNEYKIVSDGQLLELELTLIAPAPPRTAPRRPPASGAHEQQKECRFTHLRDVLN